MSRNQSLLLFIAAFACNVTICVVNASAAEARQYGQIGVVLLGVARALGAVAPALLILVIWAAVSLIGRRSLPQNFARNSLLMMAGFAILGTVATALTPFMISH